MWVVMQHLKGHVGQIQYMEQDSQCRDKIRGLSPKLSLSKMLEHSVIVRVLKFVISRLSGSTSYLLAPTLKYPIPQA